MAGSNVIEVMVFPLQDAVFFPNTAVPLNIFEPKYIKMIRRSLETKTPVALCQLSLNWARPKNQPVGNRFTGAIAGVGHPVVLREHEDGSMMILLEGIGKVELGEVVEEQPYIMCRATLIEENDEVYPENRFRFNRLKKNLQKWIKENIKEDYYRQVLLQNLKSPQQIVESLSMLLIKEADVRQRILETNDVNEKIQIMTKILDEEWFGAKKNSAEA